MSAYGGKGYMQSSAKQAAFYSHEQGQVGHQHHHHQQHVSYAPHTAHGHSSSTKHQQKFHYTPQTKPPQETLTFADSKGMHQTISLGYNPSEQGQVVQCCDPWNEHVYYLPLHLLERTVGLETHIHNKTGRRAQVCMKNQQQKCNMREKCLQIHGDWNMVEELRKVYIADKKQYVSEVLALDLSDKRNDVLSFKYSEIEAGAAKENYRRSNGKAKLMLCTNFVTRGGCLNGAHCCHVHVLRDRYIKAKSMRCQGHTQKMMPKMPMPRHTHTQPRWGDRVYQAQEAPATDMAATAAMHDHEAAPYHLQPLRTQPPTTPFRVEEPRTQDEGSDSNSSHGTSWVLSNDSNDFSGSSSPGLNDFGPTLSRLSGHCSDMGAHSTASYPSMSDGLRTASTLSRSDVMPPTVPVVVTPTPFTTAPQLHLTGQEGKAPADLEEENEDIKRLLVDLNLDL